MAEVLVDEGIGRDLVQQLRAQGFHVFRFCADPTSFVNCIELF